MITKPKVCFLNIGFKIYQRNHPETPNSKKNNLAVKFKDIEKNQMW